MIKVVFISRFTTMMPPANNWQVGDGLNIAGHRWNRRNQGTSSIFGNSLYDDSRKAITFKIDHNINAEHRISGTYSFESTTGDDGERRWPVEYNGYGSLVVKRPQTFTIALTSTLRPTLLNELRVGLSRTATMTHDPFTNPRNDNKVSPILIDLLRSDDTSKFPRYSNLPIVPNPGLGTMLFSPEQGSHLLGGERLGGRNATQTRWGGVDPRWSFADTITWMKGAHSFKGGIEYRTQKSWQEQDGQPSWGSGVNAYPTVNGGVLTEFSPFRSNGLSGTGAWLDMPTADVDYREGGPTMSGNYDGAHNLMTYMAGSLRNMNQYFFVVDAKNPRWNNAGNGELTKVADLRNREISFFFKDDWKFSNSLTLNLGVRYEYWGVPYEARGLTGGIEDGWSSIMGITGGDLSTWMPTLGQVQASPDNKLTRQVFVGPNSLNPDKSMFNKDMNNWAPHVGFSWQVPWLGSRGSTTLRGGYSISYLRIGNYDITFGYTTAMSTPPGAVYAYTYTGHDGCLGIDQNGAAAGMGCYLNFDNFGKLLPLYDPNGQGFIGMEVQPTILGVQPVYKRDMALTVYDPNIRNPYVQNLNLSLTHQLGRNLTLDARYIGTLTRKGTPSGTLGSGINVNTPNLINSGLMKELLVVRAGGQSDLLNEFILPGTLYRANANEDPNMRTGSDQIRAMWGQNLANGNFQAIASALATTNGNASSIFASQFQPGVNGMVLRAGGAPENWLTANPQYSSVTVRNNWEHANYHSLQLQATMRPWNGLNFQTTYTWSRNLARPGAITDYRDWDEDYWLSAQHRSHQFNINGTYTLPFGPNSLLLRNASGAVKKMVEGWQIGWIGMMSSGSPMSLTGIQTLWGNATTGINQVGPFDTKSGKVKWDSELNDGFYFGRNYIRIIDPQCFDANAIDPALARSFCNTTTSIRAIVEVDESKPVVGWRDINQTDPVRGTIIFQNARAGERGNFLPNNLTGVGRFSLDMNFGKSVEFMEGKRIELRIDAQNILNHATPSESGGTDGIRNNAVSNPYLTINTNLDTEFGRLSTKTGHRTFQARIRLSF